MFKNLSTRIIQHLITQNRWAAALLRPFAGKSVLIHIAPIKTSFVILENGTLATAGETNIPDATISIAPSLLPRLIAKDESAKLEIEISGDTEVATALAKVFSHLRWDYEDDLSKLLGDVPAYKIATFGQNTIRHLKDTTINVAEMLSEYWQEENPTIAKKRHVEQFNAEVDTLRADIERLEKRFNKISSNSSAHKHTHQPTIDSIQ